MVKLAKKETAKTFKEKMFDEIEIEFISKQILSQRIYTGEKIIKLRFKDK